MEKRIGIKPRGKYTHAYYGTLVKDYGFKGIIRRLRKKYPLLIIDDDTPACIQDRGDLGTRHMIRIRKGLFGKGRTIEALFDSLDKKWYFIDNEVDDWVDLESILKNIETGGKKMEKTQKPKEVSPQEKSSSNPGGEKIYSGARKCPECGSRQYVKRTGESENVPAVICHGCGYVFSSAPAVTTEETKKPNVAKPKPKSEEISSEITFDEVLKNLEAIEGITTIQETDKRQRVRIKSGNNLLFILLHRGEGVTVKGRDEEGKYHNYRIEKSEDLKPWYNLAKENVED